MPNPAFSKFLRRLVPSCGLLLSGGMVLLSGCFQAQALYRSANPTGRPSIDDLEAASFPLPPAYPTQGAPAQNPQGIQQPQGMQSHPGWQQQYGMPPMQPAAQWPAMPQWQLQVPPPDATTAIVPTGPRPAAPLQNAPAQNSPASPAGTSRETPEPVGNRMASWLRNAAFGPADSVQPAAVGQPVSVAAPAAAAAASGSSASQGTARIRAQPVQTASARIVSAADAPPAATATRQNTIPVGPAAAGSAAEAQHVIPAAQGDDSSIRTALANADSPTTPDAVPRARTPQPGPVPAQSDAPIRLVQHARPAAADRLIPVPDPTVPSSTPALSAASRATQSGQTIRPVQYSRPSTHGIVGPSSPVSASAMRATPVRSADMAAPPAPVPAAPAAPVPGPQQQKAIRVAALLKALVQEDRQPDGGELARRRRMMVLNSEQASVNNPLAEAAPGTPPTATEAENAGENTPGVPRITATPVAVSLSAIVDSPGDGLPATLPPTGNIAALAAATTPNTNAAPDPATDRTRLAEQVRRLSEQLQALAGPGSTSEAHGPSLVRQVSWQSAPPAGSPVSNEATVALLMLRIEQISAQLHQLQSTSQAMPHAARPVGAWQYQQPAVSSQPAMAPAAISPAELQMLAAVLNRATAATAERRETISSPPVPTGAGVYQPAAWQQPAAGNSQADLSQLAGRVAELARQLESASQP